MYSHRAIQSPESISAKFCPKYFVEHGNLGMLGNTPYLPPIHGFRDTEVEPRPLLPSVGHRQKLAPEG